MYVLDDMFGIVGVIGLCQLVVYVEMQVEQFMQVLESSWMGLVVDLFVVVYDLVQYVWIEQVYLVDYGVVNDFQVQCFQFLGQFIGSVVFGVQFFVYGGFLEEEGSFQDSICCSVENLLKINFLGIVSVRQVNFVKGFMLLQYGVQME